MCGFVRGRDAFERRKPFATFLGVDSPRLAQFHSLKSNAIPGSEPADPIEIGCNHMCNMQISTHRSRRDSQHDRPRFRPLNRPRGDRRRGAIGIIDPIDPAALALESHADTIGIDRNDPFNLTKSFQKAPRPRFAFGTVDDSDRLVTRY